MDRETLVLRNTGMAEAFHQTPIKHLVRRSLLKMTAHAPISHSADPGVQRILIVRPDHLGDMLLTTPAIRTLRAALPDAEIHALVGEWSAEPLSYYEEIDHVLTIPFPGFKRGAAANALSPYQLALKSAGKLRKIGYHAALILRPDHWWGALITFLAGIPNRIGYTHPDVEAFLTRGVVQQREHAVLQNLRLIQALLEQPYLVNDPIHLPLRFPVHEADRGVIDDELYARTVRDDKPLVVIHPGAGTWVKRWEPERWAQVADILAHQLDAVVVFTGGDHERDLVQDIQSRMKQHAISLVGETGVGGLAALFQRARIVLGPDSGPLHLAVAVGTPTVTLFGAADPVEFGSWGDSEKHPVLFSDIACRPCRVLDWGSDDPAYHPCVRDISVARVLEAANRALSANQE